MHKMLLVNVRIIICSDNENDYWSHFFQNNDIASNIQCFPSLTLVIIYGSYITLTHQQIYKDKILINRNRLKISYIK